MIHQPDYVKELIKKYIEGSMTGVELERLKACWKIYEEDELLNMTAEVLYAMEKQAPGDSLEGWEPDFAKIINDAKIIQRKKRIWLYSKIAGAACLLVVLAVAVNHLIEQWSGNNTIGDCGNISSRSEIPKSEFACTIRWGDTTVLTVDSGSTGLVTQISNLNIRAEVPGVLALTRLPVTTPVDTTRGLFVEVLTPARRQHIIKLPGSISVHLNAGSSLKLPLISTGHDTCYVQISGEAYIEVPEKKLPGRLIVETSNSQLQTAGGNFAITALPGYTRATLISGSLITFSRGGIHSKALDCRGDQAVVRSYAKSNGPLTDSLFYKRSNNVEEALVWTKATRSYRNVSLRQFVMDMSRWYGFKVESLNCIPEQLRINTSVCYRASRQQVYSEIRKAGIKVYETGESISFCNPANSFSPSQIMSKEKGNGHPGYPRQYLLLPMNLLRSYGL
ncbi:hypothetical protein [Agriterribacter sp.]|uniref:hypothetical protein n=1 Tax=Agriterribacter sp. TaxID=2821509 RepID=UPI002B9B0F6D|nr:hypothetical protein [Agriterribacter sp.]HRP58607.1 hypothetical protein [Agriterribacter sp.]